MKNLLPVLMLTAVVGLATTFSSCSGNKKKNNNAAFSEIKKSQVEKEVADFVYPLPTSFEVTNMLNEIGAAYILTLSNPAEKAGEYLTTMGKALNLGVYGADLSYASTYNQKQITIDYMNASNQLIEELNFANAIEDSIVKKVEEHQDDKEELIDLISGTFYDAYRYLNKHDRGEISLLILAGSWVEGVYICTNISEETYNNVELVSIIMKQKEPLENLIGLLEKYEGVESIDEVLSQLTKIHSIYNSVEDNAITEKQLNEITKEVSALRIKITG